jgi:integrase/recombinase XerD
VVQSSTRSRSCDLRIANHESPRTTKLYDRTNDAISLDEIERILI